MHTYLAGSTGLALDPATLDHLADHGWAIQDGILPPALAHTLAQRCRILIKTGLLKPAGVGRGDGHAVRLDTRGDQIFWLDAGHWSETDLYLSAMDEVRLALNQAFYLGLADHECHFAYYPPGTGYRAHLDRFKDDDARTVSAVFYLNDDWQTDQGGALRLVRPDALPLDVTPVSGRLVLFMSADIEHEVLPAARDRLSIAGWFRRSAPV